MNFGNVFKTAAALFAVLTAAVTLPSVVSAQVQADPGELELISELTGYRASYVQQGPEWVFDETYRVYLAEPLPRATTLTPDPLARQQAISRLRTVGLLFIPDSTNKRIMTFDPVTGDLIDPNFILLDNDATGTVVNAIMGPTDNILVSDQTRDVVHQYDLDGTYLGIFAPAGGANTAILDNIRGIALKQNGHLLVTVAAGGNQNAIAEFDFDGNWVGNFIAAGSGGLNSPFEVYLREGTDWLVGGSSSSMVHRYHLDTGDYLGDFAPVATFPQQILELPNDNVLVANFSSTQGVHEFLADGSLVGVYRPAALSSFRGVWELPNGNILTSTSGGVYEIDRSNNLIDTKYTGQSRYIEYVVDWTVSIENPDEGAEGPAEVPTALAINAVAPNPFNPRTTVFFDLPQAAEVTLAIHDLRGRLVATLWQGALAGGHHRIDWDGLDAQGHAMPSGIYLARLTTAGGEGRTVKMTLAR